VNYLDYSSAGAFTAYPRDRYGMPALLDYYEAAVGADIDGSVATFRKVFGDDFSPSIWSATSIGPQEWIDDPERSLVWSGVTWNAAAGWYSFDVAAPAEACITIPVCDKPEAVEVWTTSRRWTPTSPGGAASSRARRTSTRAPPRRSPYGRGAGRRTPVQAVSSRRLAAEQGPVAGVSVAAEHRRDTGRGGDYPCLVTRAPILAALVLAACGGSAGPPGFSSGPPVTSASETTSGSSSTGDSSSTGPADDSAGSSGSSSSSDTGILRDVGTAMDFGPVQPPGCKGKVDILFVISRLGTMVTEQTQLLASFPGFIDTIEQKLEGFDVHILTANPDGLWPGYGYCEGGDGQCSEHYPNCGPHALGYDCQTYADLVTECDKVLGAGLTFNVGGYAVNKLCDLHGGHRYIVGDDPDMAGAFECIAKVGASGGGPFLGDAMIAAISPKLNGPGGCNEGFVRDDALLVVVFISDVNDQGQSWYNLQYDAIIAAKGDPDSVVMLAVVPQPLGDAEPVPGCSYDNTPPPLFGELFSRFSYTAVGATCAPSYAPFFDEAIGKISEACASFIPQ
jgi:hypothetical protein